MSRDIWASEKELTWSTMIMSPDWTQSFTLMCDASDYVVGVVLGQKKDKML